MGTPVDFRPEKLVIAALLGAGVGREEALTPLSRDFGPADFTSREMSFDFTDYYAREMGPGLRRIFVSFRGLVGPERLAEIKLATNRLEAGTASGGKRRINLDPGLLCLSRFVLATTKESSHRIPLSSGIYGEVTLMFEGGTFRPLEWTYPDYRSPQYISVLNGIRSLYRSQISGEALR
jgi:hypothetical protein